MLGREERGHQPVLRLADDLHVGLEAEPEPEQQSNLGGVVRHHQRVRHR